MHNKLVCCLSVVVLGACSGNEPTPVCKQDSLRCLGDVLQQCVDQKWTEYSNCTYTGKVCGSSSGVAACEVAPKTCDLDSVTASTTTSWADSSVSDYQTVVINDATTTPPITIYIENWPSFDNSIAPGTTGSVDLSGGNADYATCGVCVLGFDDNNLEMMAESGTVEFTQLDPQLGGTIAVSLKDVVMREVSIDWGNTYAATDVAGGQRWCIGDLSASATNERIPCDNADSCAADSNSIARCVSGELVPEACPGTSDICTNSYVNDAECAPPCTSDEVNNERCDSDTVEVCYDFSDGVTYAWIDELVCAAGTEVCDASVATAGCYAPCSTADASRCSADELETCNGTSWQSTEDCAGGGKICDDPDPAGDAATPAACGEACTATDLGKSRCGGDMKETCDGTAWYPVEDCSFTGDVCDDSNPADPVCGPMCDTAGNVRCTGNAIEACTGQSWQTDTACGADVCSADPLDPTSATCLTATCSNAGDQRCVSNYSQTCNGTDWVDDAGSDCGDYYYCAINGTTGAAECLGRPCTAAEDGKTRCSDTGKLQTCDYKSLGTWYDFDCGVGYSCFATDASTADCYQDCSTLDDTKCALTVTESCNGTVYLPTGDCADTRQVCDDSAQPAVCVNEMCDHLSDTTRCIDSWSQNCDPGTDTWTDFENCAATGQICDVTGYCDKEDCTSAGVDARRCNANGFPQTCTDLSIAQDGSDLRWLGDTACVDPQACKVINGGTLVGCYDPCLTTEGGNERCTGDVLETCNGTDKLWETTQTCGAGACVTDTATTAHCN